MRTTTTVPKLVAPDNMESVWKSKRKSETSRVGKGSTTTALVLNGLYYNYSKFRNDALSTNKIKIVNGKYDDSFISGVWQNPYETKEVFAITVPVRAVTSLAVSVLLPSESWYSNVSISGQSFAIDFGNGTYKALTVGTPLVHTYTADGDYTWTYRLKLSNGQYRYCRTKIKVTGKSRQNTLTARNPTCAIRTVSVPGKRSYSGVTGSATLQIAYANTCGEVRKPLIVVEGLDTGLLQDGVTIGDNDIEDFFRFVRSSGSFELQDLITNNTTNDYDIIYVNWDNGVDFLSCPEIWLRVKN